MLIAGMTLMVAGFGLLPLGEFMSEVYRALWLLVTFLMASLGGAMYIVNSNPFLMNSTSPRERNHVYSVGAALWPLSGFAGSLVGGLLPGLFAAALGTSLDHPAPYHYPLLIAALLLIPALLALLDTRETIAVRTRKGKDQTGPAPLGLIAIVALVVLLGAAGEGVARTFFNVYLDAGLGMPIAQIGALAAAGQLMAVPAALAMPLLAARWGGGRTVFWGSLGIALSLLPLSLIPHWGAAGAGFMGAISLVSIRNPANIVYAMEMVSPGWQAATSGAISMSQGLSFAAMALGGGYTITALGYSSLFLMGAGLTAAGAVLFWACFLLKPRGEFAGRGALDKVRPASWNR
jgi:predicted MFS family arabinose efflux permease